MPLQISVFAFIAVSVFILVALPITWTVWDNGKKYVYPSLVAWVALLRCTSFLSAQL